MRPLFCLHTLRSTGPGAVPGRALATSFPDDGAAGCLVACGGENKLVHLWDVAGDAGAGAPPRQVGTLSGAGQRVNSCAFLPSRRLLASVSSDGALRVHNVATALDGSPDDLGGGVGGAVGRGSPCEPDLVVSAHDDAVNAVAVTHDGAFLVTASSDTTVKVWSPECREVATLMGHTSCVNTVACAPCLVPLNSDAGDEGGTSGSCYLFASGGHDEIVRLWAVRHTDDGEMAWTCAFSLEGHTGWIMSCAFTPAPSQANALSIGPPPPLRLISAAWDDSLRVWDPLTGGCLRTLRHGCGVNAVSATLWDGGQHLLATAGVDGTIRLWALATGTQMCSFAADGDATRGVAGSSSTPGGAGNVGSGGASCHAVSLSFAPPGWPCAAGSGGHFTLSAACSDGTVRVFGYPPLYVWMRGLRLEGHYGALARRLTDGSTGAGDETVDDAAGDDLTSMLVPLDALARVFEPDLEAAVGMSETEASRFVEHAERLQSLGYIIPEGYISPVEQVTAFVASFLSKLPGAEPPARLVVDRLGLAAPEDTGALSPDEWVTVGRVSPEAGHGLAAEAQRCGYIDACARRADAARRRQREAQRRAGITERCSIDGVTATLRALAISGAPPTASAFFICHCRAEAEDGALALGEDLVAVSDDVVGHSIDEVWCGHQCFPSDVDTETAMLNGVRGATAFLLFLSASTLSRPYCLLECRAAKALNKPLVVVHETDPAAGGADWHECLSTAPGDLVAWLTRADVAVLTHRVAPEQRRLLMGDIFRAVRSQGGVFHALISISAHASLLAEVHALRGALAAEKALVLELGQSTLVTEIALLRTELEQETAATAVQRRRADELSDAVRRLTDTAAQWEDQLGAALDREAEAQRAVSQLTEALEALQSASGERERQLQDSMATLGSDMSRLAGAVGADGGSGISVGAPLGGRSTPLGGALTRVARYALAGLFQSIGGGGPVERDTLASFLSFLRCPPNESAALVAAADSDGDGVVSAADWDVVTGDWLGG